MPTLRKYARSIGASVALERHEVHSSRSSGPGLLEVLAAARAGKINIVIVPRLDRLGRRASTIIAIVEQLRADGCRFDACQQGIVLKSSPDPMTLFGINILAAVAQAEHDAIIERTIDGLAAARRRGSRLGRPPLELPDVAAVNAMVAGGASWPEIQRQLGCSEWAARSAARCCINCGRRDAKWRACRSCGQPVCDCGHHRGATAALRDERAACIAGVRRGA
jgi:DNA invertase Pin-like site-specific DNA recombinase